eukprot:TRINITY_DN106450_c0_g1_i1.p1 TRINITY_DN106450_c0_g1~~TRINITY_DN106450_c0_g1_i1.p1  ORF type:complete len:412 (-),score=134.41 TRINITY_DN106450_c0_g1_i1:43-1278(-)
MECTQTVLSPPMPPSQQQVKKEAGSVTSWDEALLKLKQEASAPAPAASAPAAPAPVSMSMVQGGAPVPYQIPPSSKQRVFESPHKPKGGFDVSILLGVLSGVLFITFVAFMCKESLSLPQISFEMPSFPKMPLFQKASRMVQDPRADLAKKASTTKGVRKPQKAPIQEEEEEESEMSVEEALSILESDAPPPKPKKKSTKSPKKSDTPKPKPADKGKDGSKKKGKEKASEEDDHHVRFAKHLKEEQERKVDFTLADVKKEFKKNFTDNSKQLLCSGCKLIAQRLESALEDHDVHGAEGPADMLLAKRKALDAACRSFRHYHIVPSETEGMRYEATENNDDEEIPAQKLCKAILEDARFDMLAKMIQHKMLMENDAVKDEDKKALSHNWERWLCAEREKLCKHREVRDDDEL